MSDMGILVEPVWLSAHLAEVRVVDLRWSLRGPPGRQLYDAGHVPGAVFVDLEHELTGVGPGRHPWPADEDFAKALSRIGVGPRTPVVVYDARDGSTAARLWFMLRAYGHAQAALLDGGYQAWVAAGLPVSTEEPRIAPSPLQKLVLDKSRIVDAGQVQARGATPLLDARAPERYRGETEPVDKKAGHIPGSINAPYAKNLDPQGRFLAPPLLRKLYESYKLHGSHDSPGGVITSCGSGVTACHDIFAMELAGLPPARLYVGSWSGWIEDPSRPIATGPEPG
ncbi:MAG TPA: sulfurtransferase [Myxococcales bacterium]|nr:sulfurtransferase [Myxococcales bacterium]